MRVLVCGGRDYDNAGMLATTLACLHVEHVFDVLIEGDARGADKMAGQWARENDIKLEVYPAQWDVYGKGAGYVRNAEMLTKGKPDLVVAFPGGRGTAMMCKIAEDAGIKVERVLE